MTLARKSSTAAVFLALLPTLLAAACATSKGGNEASAETSPANSAQGVYASRPPGANDLAPEQLVGLDGDQLIALLGPADFQRQDGPAEIWQFRDPDCVLDVFLYADSSTGSYRVLHVDARDRTLVLTADPACVTGLLRQRRQSPAPG
ncbi:MAG: hypothetical protein IPK66_04210 [Rhodospirillales bacterium]|nr:hypothetical protein [Rhodospirillales bacterium]